MIAVPAVLVVQGREEASGGGGLDLTALNAVEEDYYAAHRLQQQQQQQHGERERRARPRTLSQVGRARMQRMLSSSPRTRSLRRLKVREDRRSEGRRSRYLCGQCLGACTDNPTCAHSFCR